MFGKDKMNGGNYFRFRSVFIYIVTLVLGLASMNVYAADSQNKELTIWEYYSQESAKQGLNELASLFEKTHPNVNVNYVYVPYRNLPSKLIAAAGAGTGPDIILYNGTDVGSLAKAGAIIDLSQKWEKFEDKSEFPRGVVHHVSGDVYGIQGYVNLLALYYNKDILDKFDVKPPKTITQLGKALKKIRKNSNNIIGLTLSGKPNDQGEWQAYPWLSAYGWSYKNLNVDACINALNHIGTWASKGSIPQRASIWGQTKPFTKFLVGNVAFAENGNWQLIYAKNNADFDYGVIIMPKGNSSPSIYLGGEVLSIGAFSKHPKLAWDFIRTTFLSKKGELIYYHNTRSIPSRDDARKDIAGNGLVKAFMKEVGHYGHIYPPAIGPTTKVKKMQLVVARHWSTLISDQEDAATACKKITSNIKKVKKGESSGLLQ